MNNDSQSAPTSGSIPYAFGQSTVIRIPIPGTDRLCVELRPRGRLPKGGSTSTLFFQDVTGKRQLRLDHGWNPATRTWDYHWNQRGVYNVFKIANHTPVGFAEVSAFHFARYFSYAGRVLFVVAAASDVISIVQSKNKLRRASEAVAGWAGAWVGCEVGGASGAAVGLLGTPLAAAVGGIGGCIVGGALGYAGGAKLGDEVYDWGENPEFIRLVPVSRR
jgi:hypothetical protein